MRVLGDGYKKGRFFLVVGSYFLHTHSSSRIIYYCVRHDTT